MQKRYAIVVNGIVQEIVLWDKDKPSAAKWKPREGEAIECPDDLHLGATYDGKKFTNPPHTPSAHEIQEKVGPDNLTESERATFKSLAAKVAG